MSLKRGQSSKPVLVKLMRVFLCPVVDLYLIANDINLIAKMVIVPCYQELHR